MQAEPAAPPVALTIAGSDNSAGAGIQADLKTFAAHSVYGLTAVTCVVAEVPGRVSMVEPMPARLVAEQVRLALGAFPVAAIKTGMLFSREIIGEVAALLGALAERPKLVVDPVMIASSGEPLLRPDAVDAYRELLFPLADLITPNLDEARALSGEPIATREAMPEAAERLRPLFGAPVLLKGGHFGGPDAVDVLVTGQGAKSFRAAFVPGVDTHGTGCTYSAAIAAGLARGSALTESVRDAKTFVTGAITSHHRWSARGQTMDALDHFWRDR